MVKLVAFFRRKPGVSVEEFQRHWRTRHAELVVRQAGLRRYVQNHTLPSGYRRGEPDYDGVAEAWFDGVDAMRALAPSAEYRAVREDEARFIDAASMGVVLSEEVAILDRPAPARAAKMIAFLRKRADLTPEQFQTHWREMHGPIAATVPGNRRYVQCHARLGIYQAGRAPPFDGIPMSWFDDEAALRTAGRSPELARTRADEANFLAPGRLPLVVAREVEIDVRTGASEER
ncbi:MAG TPA: EthD family reductase [Myxococcota bacterium]|jgi:uncharacterized protein (TIGR02118 family)